MAAGFFVLLAGLAPVFLLSNPAEKSFSLPENLLNFWAEVLKCKLLFMHMFQEQEENYAAVVFYSVDRL